MAKVKIQGHASGTGILTVTAPNTSTDRTITLPDATGTLLNSDGDGSSLTGLSSFDPDGAVTINDTGADVDFRVESDTLTHALFVEGSDGKVGIGAAPDRELTVSGGNSRINILSSTSDASQLQFGDAANSQVGRLYYEHSDNSLRIHTNDTECWRISSSGRQSYNGSTASAHATFVGEVAASGYRALAFERTVGGGEVGTIVANASTTSYNTSSDYRLKENVVPMTDSIDRLKGLKPSRFNFITDADNTVDGFLAHEVSSVVPEAISGEKDAMTTEVLYVEGDELPEGKNIGDVKEASVIDPQGIDKSKLVPLLVSALQEAITRIETLENA